MEYIILAGFVVAYLIFGKNIAGGFLFIFMDEPPTGERGMALLAVLVFLFWPVALVGGFLFMLLRGFVLGLADLRKSFRERDTSKTVSRRIIETLED